jgi:hypothetical protein
LVNEQQSGEGGLIEKTSRHLGEVELGYFTHARVAFGIGATLMLAGGACVLHGILPGIFRDRASRTVKTLHRRIEAGTPASRYMEAGLLEFEI